MSWLLTKLATVFGERLVDKLVSASIAGLSAYMTSKSIRDMGKEELALDTERYYLLKSINGAKTNEERKALSITLARLHTGKLPKSNNKGKS